MISIVYVFLILEGTKMDVQLPLGGTYCIPFII